MRQMPSAPASAQAFAISAMSVTLGESFMKTGFRVTAFTARVTSAAALGSEPKFFPPAWTLGQEMFTSRMAACSTSFSLAQFSAYSFREKPPTLAITGPWKSLAMLGTSSAITASMPGFWSPTALSIPAAVSAIRGWGLPGRLSAVVPFQEKLPRMSKSYSSAYSRP